MGNSAATISTNRTDYQLIEKMCKTNEFHNDYTKYELFIKEAIKQNAIDVLEILLPISKHHKKLLPLHISCLFNKLECTELLLSAGYSCYSKDQDGCNPLHICSKNLSFESSLCATLIILHAKKSISMLDHYGNTPLHVAIIHNNIYMIEVFVNNNIDIDIPNAKGNILLYTLIDYILSYLIIHNMIYIL